MLCASMSILWWLFLCLLLPVKTLYHLDWRGFFKKTPSTQMQLTVVDPWPSQIEFKVNNLGSSQSEAATYSLNTFRAALPYMNPITKLTLLHDHKYRLPHTELAADYYKATWQLLSKLQLTELVVSYSGTRRYDTDPGEQQFNALVSALVQRNHKTLESIHGLRWADEQLWRAVSLCEMDNPIQFDCNAIADLEELQHLPVVNGPTNHFNLISGGLFEPGMVEMLNALPYNTTNNLHYPPQRLVKLKMLMMTMFSEQLVSQVQPQHMNALHSLKIFPLPEQNTDCDRMLHFLRNVVCKWCPWLEHLELTVGSNELLWPLVDMALQQRHKHTQIGELRLVFPLDGDLLGASPNTEQKDWLLAVYNRGSYRCEEKELEHKNFGDETFGVLDYIPPQTVTWKLAIQDMDTGVVVMVYGFH